MSTRNPSGPTLLPIRSWDDGYAALYRRAGETRGWIELDDDVPDRRWPRTTGLDVIVIASFIDEALASISVGPTLAWVNCTRDLERDALQALVDTYRGNRDFWSCLKAFCEYLAVPGGHLPPPIAWSAVLGLVGITPASPVTLDAPPVWFAREKSLDKLHLAQRDHLTSLHGAHLLEPEPDMPGGTMAVPHSTNAEVCEIANFWSAVFQSSKVKNEPGHAIIDTSWRAALEDVAALTAGADPGAVYRKNNAFWRAISAVAAHVGGALRSGIKAAAPRSLVPPRNVSAPSIRSWSDGFAALRQRAGEARGWIELDTDAPDRRWPRTTGLDVIVIAAFIDAAFSSTDQVTFSGTALRWQECKDDIERDAIHALGETYVGNRDFWFCIAMMCSHLAFVACPLPPQATWNAVLAEIGVALATPFGTDLPPIWFASMTSLDKLYLAQRQYLARLRGSDRLEPQPGMTGGTMLIPRTTNADVLQLAGFWSAVLRIEKAQHANGYVTVAARWRAVLDDMTALTEHTSPAAVYPKNHAFWRAASSIAVHVAAAVDYGLSDAELQRVIGGQLGRVRNAASSQDRPPVWFASAEDLIKLYLAQRSYLANLHGSDKLPPEPDMNGGVMIVPRSTNGEVLQLAAFWTKALESEKAKNANGYDTVHGRMVAAQRDIDAHARGGSLDATYPKNHAFWRTIESVAIHVAASNKYGLTDAQVWMASVGESLKTAGDRTKALATVIAASVREGAADAAHAAGKVIHEGARGLFGSLAVPLLIGGGALAAFLLLRNRREASRGEPR